MRRTKSFLHGLLYKNLPPFLLLVHLCSCSGSPPPFFCSSSLFFGPSFLLCSLSLFCVSPFLSLAQDCSSRLLFLFFSLFSGLSTPAAPSLLPCSMVAVHLLRVKLAVLRATCILLASGTRAALWLMRFSAGRRQRCPRGWLPSLRLFGCSFPPAASILPSPPSEALLLLPLASPPRPLEPVAVAATLHPSLWAARLLLSHCGSALPLLRSPRLSFPLGSSPLPGRAPWGLAPGPSLGPAAPAAGPVCVPGSTQTGAWTHHLTDVPRWQCDLQVPPSRRARARPQHCSSPWPLPATSWFWWIRFKVPRRCRRSASP